MGEGFNFAAWLFNGDGLTRVAVFLLLFIVIWPKIRKALSRLKIFKFKVGPVEAEGAFGEETNPSASEVIKIDKRVNFLESRMRHLDKNFTQFLVEFTSLKNSVTELTLGQHTQVFYMKDASNEVRMLRGLLAVAAGENGKVKIDVNNFIHENMGIYLGIIVSRPDLKIPGLEKT